ncbi:hypothetical protein PDR5_01320 [Pseudomonas sp. DR 5-09]|nr:hypothetical protein PDR5_01320 [Pseudomonas sp. DR 5-09]
MDPKSPTRQNLALRPGSQRFIRLLLSRALQTLPVFIETE